MSNLVITLLLGAAIGFWAGWWARARFRRKQPSRPVTMTFTGGKMQFGDGPPIKVGDITFSNASSTFKGSEND